MPRRIVLDSSVVIPHLRGIFDIAEQVAREDFCFLPLTVLGELYRGVLNSRHPEQSRATLDDFLLIVTLLHPDLGTAMIYARLSHELRLKGRPIPENDIWIAAIAMEHGLPLATRDAHFGDVPGLQLVRW
jgi:tRNA(fMet)-specific endonuclease VapC